MKYKWTKKNKKAFEEIKWIVARNILLSYLYFDKLFKIHTNASDLQLVAVINHEGRPIA